MKLLFARRWRPVAGVLGASLLLGLAGCNGGGGDAAAPGGTAVDASGGTAAATVWYDYWVNGTQLRSLPREDFSAVPTSLGAYADAAYFWLYTPVSGSGATSGLDNRNSVLLYIANNRFYRLASAGVTRPAPIQVSSEAAANSICDWHDPQLNTPNLELATFKYRMPGKDQKCLTGDDEIRGRSDDGIRAIRGSGAALGGGIARERDAT
jgi:hypothetical protein